MNPTGVKVHRHTAGAPKKGLPVRRRLPGRVEYQSSRAIRRRERGRRDPSEPGQRARRGPWARARSWTARTGGSTRLPAESFGLTPAAPPKGNRAAPWNRDREAHKGRNMVERVFNRMKHHRKAATRHDRLDETLLANPWPILIAIYLKNTAKTQLV